MNNGDFLGMLRKVRMKDMVCGSSNSGGQVAEMGIECIHFYTLTVVRHHSVPGIVDCKNDMCFCGLALSQRFNSGTTASCQHLQIITC